MKTRPRNEALDLSVYSMAALDVLEPDLEALIKNLERKAEAAHRKTEPEEIIAGSKSGCASSGQTRGAGSPPAPKHMGQRLAQLTVCEGAGIDGFSNSTLSLKRECSPPHP